MQRNKIILTLEHPQWVEFIDAGTHLRLDEMALRLRNRFDLDLPTAISILSIYQKAQRKIPGWVDAQCALTQRAYEQCSSQRVAEYRSSLFHGKEAWDMTAGLGVDGTFLSHQFESVYSVEVNPELVELLRFNSTRLGRTNHLILHSTFDDALTSLNREVDLIFIDPDRRPGSQRVHGLADCEPNVLSRLDELTSKSQTLALKLSPMVDLTELRRQIPLLTSLAVISELNEVKEIMAVVGTSALPNGITAVNLDPSGEQVFSSSGRKEPPLPAHCVDQHLVFEPGSALIKAGLADEYAQRHSLLKLGKHSFLYTANDIILNSPGKWFEVVDQLDVNWKGIRKVLSTRGIHEIMITKRDFPESVETIRKRLGIKDGGQYHLYFYTNWDRVTRCLLLRRMRTSDQAFT